MIIWTLFFTLLELHRPGSFSFAGQGGAVDRHSLLPVFTYVSLETLSTLGYGDVVPVSMPARMLATLEATLGTLFLCVLIARLVGLEIVHSQEAPAAKKRS